MARMSLTGNIEVFPLQEVLRLLARSNKNGCLRVESGSVNGRIYLDNGALTLATVHSDRDMIEQLDAAGFVDESVHRMDANEVYLPDHIGDRSPSDLTDFIREHVVESLYRMRRPGTGTFEFLVDATSRFRTGQSFDAEVAVSEADRRASEWMDIESTISDMLRPVRMVRELTSSEVSITSATWRVLAALGGGASVERISRELGMTQFRSAREVAGLMRAGLVEFSPDGYQAPRAETSAWTTSDRDDVPRADEPSREEDASTPPSEAPAESDWSGPSWAQGSDEVDEPVSEDIAADSADETTEASASADDSGWWADAVSTPEPDEVDSTDADAFLESVFSQLDEPEAEEETGFSMGLLRRRRMGPLSKDITESD